MQEPFTRRAAEQMRNRAASVIPEGTAAMSRLWGGTFHAIANRLLRIYAQDLGGLGRGGLGCLSNEGFR